MQLLKGKRALVTGGTAGIGKQVALTYAQQGAHVAIMGTSEERGATTISELKEHAIDPSQEFLFLKTNVSQAESVLPVLEQLLSGWGGLDILVNNAGITRDQLLMRMSEEDWDDVLDTNLKSAFLLTKGVVRPMMKARSGRIINISSVVGLTGNAGQANYAASKAGLVGFTKSLALELAARGILVNCIAPGFIETRMTDALTEEQKKAILSKVPLGRMGSPQSIADAALFLACHFSDYMTGQVLVVDGGMVM